MAKTTKKKEPTKETAPVVTRAEKKDATKKLIREILAVNPLKHNELLEEVAKKYVESYGDGNENVNDVKGRIGSVLDIMKKDSDIMYDGGMYALKAREILPAPIVEEAPTPKKRGRKPKEKAEPLPPAPLQPIAPVDPTTPEAQPEPAKEEGAPKKRGRKPKAKAEKPVEVTPVEEAPQQEEKQEEVQPIIEEKTEMEKPVIDMSFLFGGVKAPKPVKAEEKKESIKTEEKLPAPVESKPVENKTEEKPPVKAQEPKANVRKMPKETVARVKKSAEKPLTSDERLRENFLKRLRMLGGEYFEYYSVYLLERYSMKNGRRLEGLKISGGGKDGGIDGEIELTDKLGFKETIYIQSKNWNPEKGDERLWIVGETLLQQFIGACACRQAKDGKQNCRGVFITTSRFTPEAKRILEDLSDKIVGYDGVDLYEAAKECEFGLIKKNGEWSLDERLLSGSKAFFNLY